jgi:hypothetical protein
MDKALLFETPEERVWWRSIPDALLRERASGDLYLLSWKTTATFGRRNLDAALVDMQGYSEAWALRQRYEWTGEIAGIQMVYLVKGTWKEAPKEESLALGLTDAEWAAGRRIKKTGTPLLYGWMDGGFPPAFASESLWKCSSPHPMRKSKWYPTGECPGDGRQHRLGDGWKQFAAYRDMSVQDWLDLLKGGGVQGGTESLAAAWAMPLPVVREPEKQEAWLRQAQAQETQISLSLQRMENIIAEGRHPIDNPEVDAQFPQHTGSCGKWNRRCDAWEICHGPSHVAGDPIGSGLYIPKPQYEPEEDEEDE